MIRSAAYSGDLGEVAGAHDIIVYQHPCVRGAADPVPIPPAAPLPPTIYLPCPVGLLPTKSPASSFFDCIPAELTVSGTTGFTKVMLRRTTSGIGLTVTKIAGDVTGDALIPTAAQFVKRSYDQTMDDPTGANVAGFVGSLENQYLQLSFGTTASSHYVLTLRAPANKS
ncbi:hypothetical protein WCE02_22735 [Pseudomonas juntendi]|uniref:hypothetical protein n=1 Tax=Pseudomonas TaxID=286 RepID=UPI0034D75879